MPQAIFLCLFLASCIDVYAQGAHPLLPSTTSTEFIGQDQMGLWMNESDNDSRRKMLENFSDAVSRLDLKAPGPAKREYEKGSQLLLKKSFSEAVERLGKAIAIYPNFVAAHNALGSAYLDLAQNEQAKNEFSLSVSLDNHLPHSYMNLGRAQLALKDFSGAQESMQKASELAPLDLRLLSALTYAQFLNHDYSAAIATAQRVHNRKHEGTAVVHYFAAAAWQGQNKLQEAQSELQIFLDEDPKSSVAPTARKMIEQIKNRQNQPTDSVTITYSSAPSADPEASARRILQQFKQQRELAEAEVEAEPECDSCAGPHDVGSPASRVAAPALSAAGAQASHRQPSWLLRSSVNEVAVFFSATDSGKSVSDLTEQDVLIRDNGKPPAAIMDFRNEAQLPLRLGMVIDTSSSITGQFEFEQKAAVSFLQRTVTDQRDLAFVVGFTSTVLLVQDFTGNGGAISRGVEQLAPAGGTAVWDAVKFAADKLASRYEEQPVARILVVISDGDDNCSSATLRQAIESAEHNEVVVYTVSTREFAGDTVGSMTADQAMRLLASRTGGAAFFPGSMSDLHRHLTALQQVLRSRYLISYRPASFEENGDYRSITIGARKSGHKLRVYARHGYYAYARSASLTK